MTRLASRNVREPAQTGRRPDPARQSACAPPAFKPVALPALAAAMRASRKEPARKPSTDFDAILRKFETED